MKWPIILFYSKCIWAVCFDCAMYAIIARVGLESVRRNKIRKFVYIGQLYYFDY